MDSNQYERVRLHALSKGLDYKVSQDLVHENDDHMLLAKRSNLVKQGKADPHPGVIVDRASRVHFNAMDKLAVAFVVAGALIYVGHNDSHSVIKSAVTGHAAQQHSFK